MNVIPAPPPSLLHRYRRENQSRFLLRHFASLFVYAIVTFRDRDLRWMGVFNTLDKVLRVKYGFVETIASTTRNNRIVGEASRKRGHYFLGTRETTSSNLVLN